MVSSIVDKDGIFECRKSKQGENAGSGVFCAHDVKAGTILPYYGITISDDVEVHDDIVSSDNYRTYVISADYCTKYGTRRTAKGLSVDGDPRLPRIQKLEKYKKLACQINEASEGCLPNCLLTTNPRISRADINRSLLKKVPIPIAYIVVLESLPNGTELLTFYGKEFGDRAYSSCKMNRRTHRQLADRAYAHVDALPKQTNFYK
ncbi:unnamed protein product [Ectocarpus sp. 4 AP-2014]|uniref:EsV-1-28 n=1 Tax=Ectocarpus siliculosus virus 1 (isolate New Zealand/Kaikoura/1988) TaxID=654926 RepID=Q8QNN3_ESV1K|nr:EsV-1-28 [Ectocarpus siliculosus virus 1]AAK14454.1 EsV-1-28 [Ectocarpus siliculosus virus 1]